MAALDDDVIAVAKVPGYVWDLKFKGENQRLQEDANQYKKLGPLSRVLRSLRF